MVTDSVLEEVQSIVRSQRDEIYNLHFLACAEGEATAHLARCIQYDLGISEPVDAGSSHWVSRVTLSRLTAAPRGSSSVSRDGYSASISLREFGDLLDFETYNIFLDADADQFHEYVAGLDWSRPQEIVCTTPDQWHALSMLDRPVREIHYWTVYNMDWRRGLRAEGSDAARVQLMRADDFALRRGEDRCVVKSWHFEHLGLPYRTLAIKVSGQLVGALAARRYCSFAWEVNDVQIVGGVARGSLIKAVAAACNSLRVESDILIWRFSHRSPVALRSLASECGFGLASMEQHWHYAAAGSEASC